MKIHSPTINAHLHVIKFLQKHNAPNRESNDDIEFPNDSEGISRIRLNSSRNFRSNITPRDTSTILKKIRSEMKKPNINLAIDISSEMKQLGCTNIDNSRLIKSSRNNNITNMSSSHNHSEMFSMTKLISRDRNSSVRKFDRPHPAFNSNSYRFKNNYINDIPPIGNYSPNSIPQNQPLYSFGKAARPQIIPKSVIRYKLQLNPCIPFKHIAIPNIQKTIPRNKEDLLIKADKIKKSSPFDYTNELKRLQEMVEKYSPNYDELKLLNVRAKQAHSIYMKVNATHRTAKTDL